MTISKWSEWQLKFDLDLDEAAEDAQERFISPEEARQISAAARGVFEEREYRDGQDGQSKKKEGDEWIGDYVKLIEQGWPWRVACYIAWAASPKVGRWPKTLAELATEVLGLKTPQAVYRWRQKYPTIDTVVAMMQAAPLWEHRRDVLEALVDSATDPDYKSFNDRKLYLEMVGDYVPKSKLEVGKSAKGDEAELSDDELRAIVGEQGHSDAAAVPLQDPPKDPPKQEGEND